MSVCFYNNRGIMIAIDPHEYKTANLVLHAVAGAMFQTAVMPKRTPTVTADSWQMIQNGHDLLMQTHLPLTPPQPKLPGQPGLVAVAVEWALICALASSKADFKIRSVTSGGEALAACVRGEVGLNTNCASYGPFSFIFGYVWNPDSVVTQPRPGDYASWLVSLGVGALIDKGIDALVGDGNPIGQEFVKQLNKWLMPLLDKSVPVTPSSAPGKAGDAIGDLVDSIAS
jgi:hypothetical protein